MEGFVALHRKILTWEWYDDINVCRLFIHCLLKANYTDKEWRGAVIRRGTFVSTYDKLSQETGLSVKQVRTALDKLKRTNEMANEGTRQHTVFIVKNYDEYQGEGKQKGKQTADEGQTKGKQRASTNKDNKNNNKTYICDDMPLIPDWSDLASSYWAKKQRHDLSPAEEFDKFKNHHISNATKSADWKRSWMTWYQNAVQFTKPQRGQHATSRQNHLSTVEAATEHNAQYARQLQERIARNASFGDDEALAPAHTRAG